MSNIIFLKIGWMDYYDGRKGDQITGNHTYIQNTKTGHEDRNFRAISGKCLGYAPHNTATGPAKIHFQSHFGVNKSEECVDHVTVVWIATAPKGGVYVVGWYKDARLYTDRHKLNTR